MTGRHNHVHIEGVIHSGPFILNNKSGKLFIRVKLAHPDDGLFDVLAWRELAEQVLDAVPDHNAPIRHDNIPIEVTGSLKAGMLKLCGTMKHVTRIHATRIKIEIENRCLTSNASGNTRPTSEPFRLD